MAKQKKGDKDKKGDKGDKDDKDKKAPLRPKTAQKRLTQDQIGISEKITRLFYGWVKKKVKLGGLLNEKYELKQQIGQGTFGSVYLAVNVYTSVAVAVKLELVNSPYLTLKYEYKMYEKLGCNKEGFLECFYYGPYMKTYNALCMELLGPDLDDLYAACGNHFSLKTVLMIAIRTIKLLQHVHSCNIIYRDVKPENFCIGHHYQQKEKIIYVVDFGLSKMYEDKNKIVQESEYNYLVGTARYMSVNALTGAVQSKRDDLESLAYMFVYLLYGQLPWMGLSQVDANDDANYYKIYTMKKEITPEELCPDSIAIATFLEYAKCLKFDSEPDYNHCIKLFEVEMKKYKLQNDGIYDWTEIMGKSYLTGAMNIDPDV